jgi:hypothetical protein
MEWSSLVVRTGCARFHFTGNIQMINDNIYGTCINNGILETMMNIYTENYQQITVLRC